MLNGHDDGGLLALMAAERLYKQQDISNVSFQDSLVTCHIIFKAEYGIYLSACYIIERMVGEMEKVDLGTSFKCLKMISYEKINRSGEFPREMNDKRPTLCFFDWLTNK